MPALFGAKKSVLLHKPAVVAAGGGIAFETTLSGSEAGFAGYTVGDRIASGSLASVSGTTARVTIQLATIIDTVQITAYIGQRATSGDAYDANALVQLTGGDFGAGTYTHSSGTGSVTLVSDYTTLNEAFDSSKDYLVWIYCNGAVTSSMSTSSSGNASYYKNGNTASTADKTTFVTTADTLRIVSKIEIA